MIFSLPPVGLPLACNSPMAVFTASSVRLTACVFLCISAITCTMGSMAPQSLSTPQSVLRPQARVCTDPQVQPVPKRALALLESLILQVLRYHIIYYITSDRSFCAETQRLMRKHVKRFNGHLSKAITIKHMYIWLSQ